MSAVVWADLKTEVARRAHKNLTNTDENAAVEAWVKAGIRRINREDSWRWLRKEGTITLVAATYQYSIPTDLERLQIDSVRFNNTYLTYKSVEEIDRFEGPSWRDSATGATSRYITMFGSNFWLAPIPSSTFVTDNPTISYYYYQKEDIETTPLTPDWAFDFVVHAALAEGLQQEDDPDWRVFNNNFEQIDLPKMRQYDEEISTLDPFQLPHWRHELDI